MHLLLLVVFLVEIVYNTNAQNQTKPKTLPPPCNRPIYCGSDLLMNIQLAKVFPDSKTFVDMKLKFKETVILEKYKSFKSKYITSNQNANITELLACFVKDNFENGCELEPWVPPDFTDNPSIVEMIKDKNYKQWALDLNQLWKTLAIKMKDDVQKNPDMYSILFLPNGFIKPGGRFTEPYYWDSYWIINGLLLCDMQKTVRGIIDNFLSLVKKYGFMPNGARVYYTNRSQPPMLILMALSYLKATSDFDYIRCILPTLEMEFQFWMKNRTVCFQKDGKEYKMARYFVESGGPRPESFKEDFETAKVLKTQEEKDNLYVMLKSAAESGLDFSSKWFISSPNSVNQSLSDTQTTFIIPVELNSILEQNARLLSAWFNKAGNVNKAQCYSDISKQFQKNIQEVMWVEKIGIWQDWDMKNCINRNFFFPTNFVPLWTESYSMPKDLAAQRALNYLMNNNIIKSDFSSCYYGIPASSKKTGQQWDFSHAWAPHQAFIIQGLQKTCHGPAMKAAQSLAETWLYTNYKGFVDSKFMFEKYDALIPGVSGNGGEYVPQKGFGWTNGFALELLYQYGQNITSK